MNNDFPRIAIICNSFGPSTKFRKSICEDLLTKGKLAGIYSTNNDRWLIPEYAKRWETKYQHLSFLNLLKLVLRAEQIDVVHGFTHVGNLYAFLLALLTRKKLILTITGMGRIFNNDQSDYKKLIVMTIYRILSLKTKWIIVQNSRDYELFSKYGLHCKLLKTNGSGIPLDHFDGVKKQNNKGKLRIGFFSRALSSKGVDDFYKLATLFGNKYDFLHVGHAGSGKYSEKQIIQTAQECNVSYSGFKTDVREMQLSCDVIFSPSRYREGLSRITVEAMLAGKVLVCRRTSGIEDHITNGINGYIYESEEEMLSIFNDLANIDSSELGNNARRYATETFDVRHVDDIYKKAYLT